MVVESAINGGATGFTFSTHESNLELLTYLSSHKRDLLEAMSYYILVPYAQGYVRKANTQGTPALILSIARDLVHRPSVALRGLLSLMLLRPQELAGALFQRELAPYLEILPKKGIRAVLLHEIITELAVAFDADDLLKMLTKYVEEKIGFPIGLQTRNLGHLCRWMIRVDYHPEYLMVPMNPLGYQMAPSKEENERDIARLSEKTKIIAINVLASGAVSLEESMAYLRTYEGNLHALTSASVKPERIYENFCRLSRVFLGSRT